MNQTQIIKRNVIINNSINCCPNHFIYNYFPILIKYFQWNNWYITFYWLAYDTLYFDWFESQSNKLITCSLWVPCFFCIKFIIYTTWNWETLSFLTGFRIFFAICLYCNWYWCYAVNVLNGTLVGKTNQDLMGCRRCWSS